MNRKVAAPTSWRSAVCREFMSWLYIGLAKMAGKTEIVAEEGGRKGILVRRPYSIRNPAWRVKSRSRPLHSVNTQPARPAATDPNWPTTLTRSDRRTQANISCTM